MSLYPYAKFVYYFKYAIILSLFIVSLFVKKEYPEQKLMAYTFFFVAFADFCLVFSNVLPFIKVSLAPYGILGFSIAYILLITAYQKNFKIRLKEILVFIPILLVTIYVFYRLIYYISGPMLLGALLFGLILSYMAWTSICTIFRGYFNKKSVYLIAISGIFMFICDIGVAFSLFYPIYAIKQLSFFNVIVWFCYIMGWTLLLVLVCDKNLINRNHI